jgi:hypothetical protein
MSQLPSNGYFLDQSLFFEAFDSFLLFSVQIFCVFVDSFAGNVLNFMANSNKKNNGHLAPLTATFRSETQNFRDFQISRKVLSSVTRS